MECIDRLLIEDLREAVILFNTPQTFGDKDERVESSLQNNIPKLAHEKKNLLQHQGLKDKSKRLLRKEHLNAARMTGGAQGQREQLSEAPKHKFRKLNYVSKHEDTGQAMAGSLAVIKNSWFSMRKLHVLGGKFQQNWKKQLNYFQNTQKLLNHEDVNKFSKSSRDQFDHSKSAVTDTISGLVSNAEKVRLNESVEPPLLSINSHKLFAEPAPNIKKNVGKSNPKSNKPNEDTQLKKTTVSKESNTSMHDKQASVAKNKKVAKAEETGEVKGSVNFLPAYLLLQVVEHDKLRDGVNINRFQDCEVRGLQSY